jgi:hypothetical protein
MYRDIEEKMAEGKNVKYADRCRMASLLVQALEILTYPMYLL